MTRRPKPYVDPTERAWLMEDRYRAGEKFRSRFPFSYSPSARRTFAKKYGISGQNLHKSLRIFDAFDPDDMQELLHRDHGHGLHWIMFVRLIRVHDADQRLALARRAVREQWSAGRLKAEIRRITGSDDRGDRSHPHAVADLGNRLDGIVRGGSDCCSN
jgi:hypothetical protein